MKKQQNSPQLQQFQNPIEQGQRKAWRIPSPKNLTL